MADNDDKSSLWTLVSVYSLTFTGGVRPDLQDKRNQADSSLYMSTILHRQII